jgi:hypothetical protein
MQEKNYLAILAIFLIFGVFLLKGGITGFAVSEIGMEQLSLTPEDNSALSAVGLLIVIISTALAFGYLKKHVNKLKEDKTL